MQSGAIMASVTVETVVNSERVGISLEEVGADGALLTVRTYRPDGKIKKSDRIELYSVKRVKDQNIIRCKAKAPGPDPDVTCALNAGNGPTGRSLSVEVKGTFAGLGDFSEKHAISEAHYQAGLAFLTQADFPVK